MKQNKTRVLLGLQMLLALTLAFAPATLRAEGYAGSAGAFLRMGYGAVGLGSGDAGVARAIGAEQAHYNPAGLPFAPGNEFTLGTHLLTLDRRLILTSALYQVPQIAFWRGPMRPAYIEREATGTIPTLRYVDETRKKVRPLSVDDYLQPLVSAIVEQAEREDVANSPAKDEILIQLDGDALSAGSLAPLVEEMAAELRQEGNLTRVAAEALLKRKFLRIQKRPAAVSVSWTNGGTGDIDIRDFDGQKSGELGFYENRFSLAFGLRLHEKISVGVSAGILYALVPGLMDDGSSLTSTAFIADAGVQLRPFAESGLSMPLSELTIGAAAYGLGAKNTWNTTGYWSQGTTKNDVYPDRYRVGAATSLNRQVDVFADVETDLDLLAHLKTGVELRVIEKPFSTILGGKADHSQRAGLSLRAGLDNDTPTVGFSLSAALAGLGVTTLDYAFLFEPVGPGPTQVLNWRFHLTQ